MAGCVVDVEEGEGVFSHPRPSWNIAKKEKND
jgi:hypothetical protein